MTHARTIKQLANAIGIAEPSLKNWLTGGKYADKATQPPPSKTAKGWDVDAMKLWLHEERVAAMMRTGRGNGTWTPMHDARLERLRLEIEQIKMRIALKKGELIPLEEAQEAVNFMGYQFRRAVETMPDRLAAAGIRNHSVIKNVKQTCAELLKDLEKWLWNAATTITR